MALKLSSLTRTLNPKPLESQFTVCGRTKMEDVCPKASCITHNKEDAIIPIV